MTVLLEADYNEDYFDPITTGTKHSWGYGRSIKDQGQRNEFDEGDEANPYNSTIKKLYDKLSNLNLSNVDVLDIGGAIGNFAQHGKRLGVASWTVLDVAAWCQNNITPEVDTFILGDAPVIMKNKQQFKNNGYDVIFTHQALPSFEGTRLADLITEMNRVAKNLQIHILDESVTDIPTQSKYNYQTIDSFWKNQGFESGTYLISITTGQVLVI